MDPAISRHLLRETNQLNRLVKDFLFNINVLVEDYQDQGL